MGISRPVNNPYLACSWESGWEIDENMMAIGMDVHKSKITAHAIPIFEDDIDDNENSNEFNFKFSKLTSSRPGLTQMAAYLSDKEHCILIENSTITHDIYWMLIDLGCTVMVAFATELYRITQSVKKTDEHDCKELAHYMRKKILGEEEFAVCLIVDQKTMDRRQLCRLYYNESVLLSDIRRQIRSYMLLRGIKIENEARDIVSERNLRQLATIESNTLKLLIEKARSTKKRVRECEKTISKEFSDDEIYQRIITIPGFGVITSAYISSMIIDPKRFETQKKFSAYFGIVPKQRISNETSEKCGITRRGDCIMRMMLLQATHVHITNDIDRVSSVSRTYEHLRSRGMPHKKALTAAANKMTKIVFALLSKGESYEL